MPAGQPPGPPPAWGPPPGPGPGPAAPPAPGPGPFRGEPIAQAGASRAELVLLRPDGSPGGTHPLPEGTSTVGRSAGPMFAQDAYLSPRHATFVVQGGRVTVRDEQSLNGVYVRIEANQPVELVEGDVFRVGQEILSFEPVGGTPPDADGTERMGSPDPGFVGRIGLITGRDQQGNGFGVPATGLYLGRERGDVIFPEDGYVSGLHCRIYQEGGKIWLLDVGSSNGTYVRLRHEHTLQNGDTLLVGQQLFRLQV